MAARTQTETGHPKSLAGRRGLFLFDALSDEESARKPM